MNADSEQQQQQDDGVSKFNLRGIKSQFYDQQQQQSSTGSPKFCPKHQSVLDPECADCQLQLPLKCGVSSSNDSDVPYGTPAQRQA